MAHAAEAERGRRERWGFLSGATMALGASLSFAAARPQRFDAVDVAAQLAERDRRIKALEAEVHTLRGSTA